jgi:hypothetical protein
LSVFAEAVAPYSELVKSGDCNQKALVKADNNFEKTL